MDVTAPLLVSADPLLVADVQRLCAAAGVVAEVVRDPAHAIRMWSSAPVVLVGADVASALAAASPPRRQRVHVLGRSPVGDTMFRDALGVGAETVAGLPASETWLVELLTDVGDGGAAPGVTIGVIGGSGGAGATVFAAAMAQMASQDGRTLLVDADPIGAGVDRVLGLENSDGIRWDSMLQTTGRLSSRSLREALPRSGQLSVLTWPTDRPASLQAFAMREVLSAGRRGFDAVVVDLPRHRDAVVDETISRCDHVVLVSTLTVPGVTAAARVAHRLPESTPTAAPGHPWQSRRGRAGVREPAVADPAGRGDGRPARPGRVDQPGRRAGPFPSGHSRAGRAIGVAVAAAATGRGRGMTETVSAELLDDVRERLARDAAPLTPQLVAQALREQGRPVGDATVLAVHDALHRDVVGAGPLEPLLRLEGVTDVLVNGADQVWIDRGAGLERTGIGFPHDGAVRRLAQRLAASGGRRLDDASPYVDLRLPDGSRFHAVLAPVARPGTVLSLRVPRQRVFTLAELVEAGSVAAEGAALLELVVQRRLAFLVSGGTGSGKTTLLNALLSLVGPGERLVLVEDASELRPDHAHVVALEARPANIEGAGEVTLRTLVRQALRMRPDRLVVGEVRGAEVVDMLAAMNTGHEGGCATVHANSAGDVPSRVEGLALAAGLTREATHSQLYSAVDVVIHLGRGRDRQRRVHEIGVVTRSPDGNVEVLTGVSFAADGSLVPGPAIDALSALIEP